MRDRSIGRWRRAGAGATSSVVVAVVLATMVIGALGALAQPSPVVREENQRKVQDR